MSDSVEANSDLKRKGDHANEPMADKPAQQQHIKRSRADFAEDYDYEFYQGLNTDQYWLGRYSEVTPGKDGPLSPSQLPPSRLPDGPPSSASDIHAIIFNEMIPPEVGGLCFPVRCLVCLVEFTSPISKLLAR